MTAKQGGAKRPATAAEMVRKSEARKIQAGGRRMPGGVLPPAAASALDALQSAGYAPSATACIARALVDAASRPPRSRVKTDPNPESTTCAP